MKRGQCSGKPQSPFQLPCPPSSAHSRCLVHTTDPLQEGLCTTEEEGGDLVPRPDLGPLTSLFPILKAKGNHCSTHLPKTRRNRKSIGCSPRNGEWERRKGNSEIFPADRLLLKRKNPKPTDVKPRKHIGADPDLALGSPRSSSYHWEQFKSHAPVLPTPGHSTFPRNSVIHTSRACGSTCLMAIWTEKLEVVIKKKKKRGGTFSKLVFTEDSCIF